MSLYGYARVSTTDQDLGVQEDALRAAGCQVVRFEKVTGTTREGHTQLATLLELVRAGDTLAVTRVDRLARAISDLQDVVRTLKVKGAALKAIVLGNSLSTPCDNCIRHKPSSKTGIVSHQSSESFVKTSVLATPRIQPSISCIASLAASPAGVPFTKTSSQFPNATVTSSSAVQSAAGSINPSAAERISRRR